MYLQDVLAGEKTKTKGGEEEKERLRSGEKRTLVHLELLLLLLPAFASSTGIAAVTFGLLSLHVWL